MIDAKAWEVCVPRRDVTSAKIEDAVAEASTEPSTDVATSTTEPTTDVAWSNTDATTSDVRSPRRLEDTECPAYHLKWHHRIGIQ